MYFVQNPSPMKSIRLLPLLAILFTGCATTTYYQLYNVQPSDATGGASLLYESDRMTVRYNFWDRRGSSRFLIENRSDSALFIDLGRSHLILNGVAEAYFQGRIQTKAAGIAVSSGRTRSSATAGSSQRVYTPQQYGTLDPLLEVVSNSLTVGGSVSTNTESSSSRSLTVAEQRILCVPGHSRKVVNGYFLRPYLYEACDLEERPTWKTSSKKVFDQNSTPLRFENLIAYRWSENTEAPCLEVRHAFWVSSIENYRSSDFISVKFEDDCGKATSVGSISYKLFAPNRFYQKYAY